MAGMTAYFNGGQSKVSFCHLQHEKTKYEYQGAQFAYLAFDELTHFTKTQWLYLLSRNRSKCGVNPYCRCSCNPDAGSWVAELIEWWIDQETGIAYEERSGVIRYFIHEDDVFHWADSVEELIELHPDYEENDVMSLTFITASVFDNPTILEKDPKYISKLKAQPKIERERLLGCNWKIKEGAIIDPSCFKRYTMAGDVTQVRYQGRLLEIPQRSFTRFATVDTAGTSKEKAATRKGDPPSWSVCGVWDYHKHRDRISFVDVLVLRAVWRKQVGWGDLKTGIPAFVRHWSVPLTVIENAHFGQPLSVEMTNPSPDEFGNRPGRLKTKLVGPTIAGMDDTSRGAKLERAIASGLLTRLEDIGVWIPEVDDDNEPWLKRYLAEMTSWTGLPKETSDQIDMTSYAAYHAKSASSGWGGVV